MGTTMNQKIGIAVDTEKDNDLPVANMASAGLVNAVIGKQALAKKIEKRKDLNIKGIEAVASFIAQNGSFADENRNW